MNDVQLKALEEKIAELLSQKERVIVGIDGCCAAGKTTLADKLSRSFDCNVFHMDDFSCAPGRERRSAFPKSAATWTTSAFTMR